MRDQLPHNFIALASESVRYMQSCGLNTTQIAQILVGVRYAAVSEERLRQDVIRAENPPDLGLRSLDVAAQLNDWFKE